MAAALVFFASGAVLVIEILAGRLVAPYVGVSLETYTGIIGTVLAGIALGSWVGGRMADRSEPRRSLGPLLMAGGIASLAALPIISAIGPVVARGGGGPGGIVVLAVTAFVLPTALLSAVSPMAAKVRLHSTAETGTVVGGLSAAGTAGALVGTFLTGFVFVAALPTRPVLVGVGLALVAVGVVLTVRWRSLPWAGAAAALVALGLASVSASVCDTETVYYCVAVQADPARPSGRVLVLDNLRHSYVDLRNPKHLEFRYARLFGDVIDSVVEARPVTALHIGGGGFTIPRWINATRPGSRNTVLELDPGVVDVAQERLGLRPRVGSLAVRTGDARVNLADERTDFYDLAVGDAFGGLSVPWHLTTREFNAEIARTLRPDGVYVLNVIDNGPRRLARAVAATLAAEFDHVVVIEPHGDTGGNQVLVASDAPMRVRFDPADGRVVAGDELRQFVDGAVVLRDDYAPADQLLTRR